MIPTTIITETTYDPSVDKASTVQSDSEEGSLRVQSENPHQNHSNWSSLNSKISDLLEQKCKDLQMISPMKMEILRKNGTLTII